MPLPLKPCSKQTGCFVQGTNFSIVVHVVHQCRKQGRSNNHLLVCSFLQAMATLSCRIISHRALLHIVLDVHVATPVVLQVWPV